MLELQQECLHILESCDRRPEKLAWLQLSQMLDGALRQVQAAILRLSSAHIFFAHDHMHAAHQQACMAMLRRLYPLLCLHLCAASAAEMHVVQIIASRSCLELMPEGMSRGLQ